MTEKKEKILNAALKLFAEEGFSNTSTSKVAREAGVSEGLIFRHFQNKEGLLKAIIKEGEERFKLLFAGVVMEMEPREVIRKILEIGLKIAQDEAEMSFWKLQYKIKWEMEEYNAEKSEPLKGSLIKALEKLGYDHPEKEADWLLATIDGLAIRFLLDPTFDYVGLINHLKRRYKV